MDWSTAITAAAQAASIVKDLRDIEKGLSQGELKAKMADLYSNLADVRIALADAQEEMRRKDSEISSLKAKLQKNSELVEHDGFMYAANENGKPKGVPFCPNCLSADGTQIRPANLLSDHWQCPRCKALFTGLKKFP